MVRFFVICVPSLDVHLNPDDYGDVPLPESSIPPIAKSMLTCYADNAHPRETVPQ
jgi:hypothetical protein